jgi:2-dehydro-3-deoxyphosphooctonate aldolase (KDO 8-P synthase)
MKQRRVKIGDIEVGQGCPLLFILGPCVIESYESVFEHAKQIKQICEEEAVSFIFKASYDKANRTSHKSFRGPGIKEGMRILKEVKDKLGLLVTSDIHTPQEAEVVKDVLDLIQIPALLSRQTDLIIEAARTGKPINIKKGQFMAPWDVIHAVEKAYSVGNENVIVTERGTCFGYNYLVNDFRAIPRMQEDGLVVIYDGTHSVQIPSGKGFASSGERKFVPYLVRAAVAVGVDGIFLEVHKEPDKALSDSANMIDFGTLRSLIRQAKLIREALKNG